VNGQNGQNGHNGGRRPGEESKGRALDSDASGRVYGQHSGYRNLKAYQIAELLYDFTIKPAKITTP